MLNGILRKALVLSLAVLGFAPLAVAETIYKVTADGVEAVESSAAKVLPAPDEVLNTDTIEFSIRYDDVNTGFNDPVQGATRRARLHDALEYVAEALGLSGKLDVQVEASESDGTGSLASAGSLFSTAAGFQKAISLRRLESPTSVKPFVDSEEISVTVDFGFNWHFGLDAPPAGKVDFISTLIHELTHGMGLVTLMRGDGTSQIGPNVYSFSDQFLGNRNTGVKFFDASANLLVSASTINSNIMGYVNSTSTSVYNNGGLRIPIYSPNPFEGGSSFSHVDVGTVAGNPVMTHITTTGVMKRIYSTADLGILRVIGYPAAVAAPSTLSFTPLPGSPTISVTPAGNIDFGNLGISVSGQQTVTIQNFGGGILTGSLSASGTGFSILGTPSFTLPSGESWDFTVSFSSATIGAATGTLTVTSNGGANVTRNLSATVVVSPPPVISVSPVGDINFGDVASGATEPQTVTVQNTGGSTLTGTLSVSGGVTGFAVTGTPTFSLTASASKTFTLTFSSTTLGTNTGTLTITSNGGADVTRNLIANVVASLPPAISVVPSGTFAFGDLNTGETGSKTLVVQNTGGGTLTGTVSLAGTGFSVVGTPTFSLTTGASKTFTINFSSSSKGAAAGTITITSNGGATVTLNATANVASSSPFGCGSSNGSDSGKSGDLLLVLLCLAGLSLAGGKPRMMQGRSD